MKDFRKNKDGLYICEECEKTFKTFRGFGSHIKQKHHINTKEYYNRWLKEYDEGLCKNCGKQTNFCNLGNGYLIFCSQKCVSNSNIIKRKIILTNLKRYGVEYAIKTKSTQIKSKKTRNKKYKNGWFNNDHMKKTKMQNHNDEFYNNRIKYKETCLKRYGVENAMQNEEIQEKCHKNAFKIKKFRNTNLYYQGTYELDFLERYYDKHPDITRGPRIKYLFEDKEHYYFSDFLIPSENLVIEIKSSWTLKLDNEIKEKEKTTKKNGYNYMMILDKNYDEFKKSLTNLAFK